MVEEQKKILETTLSDVVDDLDKAYFRKLQIDMHSCAISCCKRNELSLKELHQCVDKCSIPLQNAQELVNHQMESFHNRIQRCVQQCKDDIVDKVTGHVTEAEANKHHKEYDQCSAVCLKKMTSVIPSMVEKIHTAMKQYPTLNDY